MKCLVLVVVVSAMSLATPVPSGTTTRSPSQIGETIKQLTNQLMEINATSPDIITLDTRTPPKIKQHAKKKIKEQIENSHAGVAIPVDEHEVILEETTKKLNFYKLEKPTTNSGLSTWILLSGQTTPKPSRKPVIKLNEKSTLRPYVGQNVTVIVDSNKVLKPIFKKRGTTSSTAPPTTTKMVKVKASVLNGAKKVTTTLSTTTTSEPTTTPTTTLSTTSTNSSSLPLEAKNSETDLPSNGDKKTRRPSTTSTKKKKNKNRRRRPSEKKDSNSSTIIHKPVPNTKEKRIATQLYNYLSKEVMPTVGVGLAGLMVAAGLASYFLYPFGAARRSYEIDRKDKDPYTYYSDEYSGGIAEEEAIGKVIAGMPSNSLYGSTNFKTPTSRHSFNNRRVIEQSTAYTVPGEEATPAAVPEHGPRSLNVRKRRNLPQNFDEEENEIDGPLNDSSTHIKDSTTTRPITTTDQIGATDRPDRVKSFIDTLKELFHLKMYLGLQLLQNATQAVSKYVSHVQRRLDEHYRNSTLN